MYLVLSYVIITRYMIVIWARGLALQSDIISCQAPSLASCQDPSSAFSSTMIPSRESERDHGSAPWFKVPHRQFVCVEHPAKILNIEKAITTIGGKRALLKVHSVISPNRNSALSDRF